VRILAISILPIVFAAIIALPGCAAGKDIPILSERVPEARNIEANISSDVSNTEAATNIINMIKERFSPEFLHSAGIDAIYLCEELYCKGIPVPAAAIRTEGKTYVYVDVSAVRRIDVSLTHELFHALELVHPIDEEAWAGINPYETYPYDTAEPGETIRYTPNISPAFEPGFVSDYARFSAMEDRAELFTALYSGRELSVKERAAMRSDPFLSEKIRFLKDYLGKAGLATDEMNDNLFIETRYTCGLYRLVEPELVQIGPGGSYPNAIIKAGQPLADSGFEKDGMRILFDCENGFSRVYAPSSAIEPIEGETVIVEFP